MKNGYIGPTMSLTSENLPNAAKRGWRKANLKGTQTTISWEPLPHWGARSKLFLVRAFKVLLILWSKFKHYFIIGALPDIPNLM